MYHRLMCYSCTVVVQALSAVSTLLLLLVVLWCSVVYRFSCYTASRLYSNSGSGAWFSGLRPPVRPRRLSLVFRSRFDVHREPTFDTTYQRRRQRSHHVHDLKCLSRPTNFLSTPLVLEYLLSHLSFISSLLSLSCCVVSVTTTTFHGPQPQLQPPLTPTTLVALLLGRRHGAPAVATTTRCRPWG